MCPFCDIFCLRPTPIFCTFSSPPTKLTTTFSFSSNKQTGFGLVVVSIYYRNLELLEEEGGGRFFDNPGSVGWRRGYCHSLLFFGPPIPKGKMLFVMHTTTKNNVAFFGPWVVVSLILCEFWIFGFFGCTCQVFLQKKKTKNMCVCVLDQVKHNNLCVCVCVYVYVSLFLLCFTTKTMWPFLVHGLLFL